MREGLSPSTPVGTRPVHRERITVRMLARVFFRHSGLREQFYRSSKASI